MKIKVLVKFSVCLFYQLIYPLTGSGRSWDSIVGIVTSYGVDDRGIRV
jgi:hypothetical protein